MGTPRQINAILLSIKINRPKWVNMCRYELTTCWLKFHGNILNLSENIAKRFRGATFLTHTEVIFVFVLLKFTENTAKQHVLINRRIALNVSNISLVVEILKYTVVFKNCRIFQ